MVLTVQVDTSSGNRNIQLYTFNTIIGTSPLGGGGADIGTCAPLHLSGGRLTHLEFWTLVL